MELFREYSFGAARRLSALPPGHKCGRLHGHTFLLRVWVGGELDAKTGMLIDFEDVDAALRPVLDALDHHELNGLPGLENPTTEHVAMWVWTRARAALPRITRLELRESATAGVVITG
ncbi:MAG: 6-carboxytetrahydropterin synthase [Phycisphaerales bacterium]|nr:6-carboxytetrahydropterin synthase [Phycisphaerales bacterium]